MSSAAIVTLIGVGILVVALAAYLTVIAFILKHVTFTLGSIIVGIKSIAHQTQPVNAVMNDINQDLAAIKNALAGLADQPVAPPLVVPKKRGRTATPA